MCLGIPMQVIEIKNEFASVRAGGLKKKANIQMLPGVKIGDYVIVHAGFAIEKVDPQKAKETYRILSQE